MIIRLAIPADFPTLVAIHNQAITAGKNAFTEPQTETERRKWWAVHQQPRFPVYVAEIAGQVAGYFSFSPFRHERAAYHSCTEISYYIDQAYHRRGVATALVRHGIREAPDLGYRTLLAILLDNNVGSTALLEKEGFTRWGHLPEIMDLAGQPGQFIYGLRV